MEGEQKTSALVFVTPLAALVIGVIVGFIVGAGQGTSQTNPEVARLQAQIDAAKKFFPTIPEMRSIGGIVKSISGNTITLETTMVGNPFENLPTERTVTVTADTRVVELLQKDQATFQKEMEAYSKSMSAIRPGTAPTTPPAPPMPFSEKNISLNEIKVGAAVTVEANENIKEKTAFTATKVVVSMAMTPMVPPMQTR